MSFGISAGVYVKELDLSQVVRGIATAIGGIVGYSEKGDVDRPREITSPEQFLQEYGERQIGNYFHYSALAFLQQGNRLHCMRAQKDALYGGVEIKKDGSVEANVAFSAGEADPTTHTFGTDGTLIIYGTNPGTWNDDTAVRITNVDTTDHEFTLEVWYKNAEGTYELVESWIVSRKQQLDGYGRQMFLEDKINNFSNYIKVLSNPLEADTVDPKEQTTNLDIAYGSNGSTITDTEIVAGWDKFTNPNDIDVRVLINAGYASVPVQTKMKTIVESRKDCVAILDLPYASLATVGDMVTFRDTTQNFNSGYCALYAPWVTDYDPKNDVIIPLPPSGYVAAQFAYNDAAGQPWTAPMGFNRGLVNVIGVTNVFTEGDRDILYSAQINPIQMFRGEGIPIWGQKLELTKQSALDRVNVRRLLITIEKSISISLRSFIGEPNSELTRFKVRSMMEEFLDILAARGAFQTENDKGYYVQVDETNNTPSTIDLNELHAYVYVKPTRAIEFIRLGVIITSTGIKFDELVSRGIAL